MNALRFTECPALGTLSNLWAEYSPGTLSKKRDCSNILTFHIAVLCLTLDGDQRGVHLFTQVVGLVPSDLGIGDVVTKVIVNVPVGGAVELS